MQHLLVGVDELHESHDAAGAGEVVFAAVALVLEADAHAVVQEGQFAQALGQDLVAELMVLREDFRVGQEVDLGAALVALADHAHGRDLDAVHDLDRAVLHVAAREVDFVDLAIAAHVELEPDGQRVHAGHAHAVQAARDRKSTRLNSSHLVISYAVFCLKKKNTPAPQRAARSNRLQQTKWRLAGLVDATLLHHSYCTRVATIFSNPAYHKASASICHSSY